MTRLRREGASLKALALGVAVPVGLLTAAWCAGAFFLAASGAGPVRSASPLTLYSYWYWYSSNPRIEAWLYVSAIVGLLMVVLPIAPLLMPRKESLHGDARWSRAHEVRRSGLLREDGIIVGEWRGRLLMHGGTPMVSPHVYLAAPTGSGKSEGVMIPNALNWRGSLVALDVKGQLYERTAGYRAAHGQRVYRLSFAPRDHRSHCYNCFEYVSTDPAFLVADVQRVVNYLIQLGKGDDFWPLQARQLCIGLALYCYSIGETPTLPRIRALALVGDDGSGVQRWCKALMNDAAKLATLHPEARMSLGSFAASAENTAAGIAQTVTSGLTPFINDLTAAVVSSNSFDLRKLREEPMSIYVDVRPADLETVSPVLRLFFQQIVDMNGDEFGSNPNHRFLVLLGMDEFATVGRLPAIQKGIPYIRSTGLRLLALFQSGAQLTAEYTADAAKAFADNFGCAIFYTPAAQDIAGAEHLSKVLGNKTVPAKSKSRRGAWGWDDKSRSETTSDQRRPLMLPQEILRMPVDEAIVVMSGMHPIQVRKPFAAKDRRFTERYAPAPPVPKIEIRPRAAPGAAPAKTRPVTAEDVMELDTLELSEVTLDFSDIVIPKEPISDAEIEELCNRVYDRVMMPAGAVAEVQ